MAAKPALKPSQPALLQEADQVAALGRALNALQWSGILYKYQRRRNL
jgi:hypothetical protein